MIRLSGYEYVNGSTLVQGTGVPLVLLQLFGKMYAGTLGFVESP
jgi:hypothetical protein